MNRNYKRGTVWWVDLPMVEGSHVQGGVRPCVIVSSVMNEHIGVVTVCPLSTKLDTFSLHPNVHVKKDGQVLIEQITTVDAGKIGDYVGIINNHDMELIDKTLGDYLSFSGDLSGSTNSALANRMVNVEKEVRRLSQLIETLIHTS